MTTMLLLSLLLILLASNHPSLAADGTNVQTENVKYIDPADFPAYDTFNAAIFAEHTNNDLSQAKQLYEKALTMKPDMEEAMINLGSLLDKLGDRDAAVSMFKK